MTLYERLVDFGAFYRELFDTAVRDAIYLAFGREELPVSLGMFSEFADFQLKLILQQFITGYGWDFYLFDESLQQARPQCLSG